MDYRESHVGKTGRSYDSDLDDDDHNSYMARREAAILNTIVSTYLPNSKHARYLDFACGSGRVLSQLAGRFAKTVAVDVSESMVEAARQKTQARGLTVDFNLLDITQEPLDHDPFDLVTAFRFFGNAQGQLRREVLAALRPLVKPDGMLVINNHRNPRSLLARRSGDTDGLTLELGQLRTLLDEAGFTIERQWPIGPWMLAYRWQRRSVWDSPTARLLDRLLVWQWLAGLSPDMMILARPKPAPPLKVS
jgi:SAM-dependent methyltransferase